MYPKNMHVPPAIINLLRIFSRRRLARIHPKPCSESESEMQTDNPLSTPDCKKI